MLVDDGKLAWDEPIIDYIPSLHFNDPWLTAHATIRDLGSNRTGIDAFLNYYMKSGDHDSAVRAARYAPQQTPFRTFQYSNTGFAILGKAIESASGQNWEDFVTGRILKPLGMNHSLTSEYAFVDRDNLATCWLCTLPAGRPVGIDALKNRKMNVAIPHGLMRGDASGQGTGYTARVLPWRSERNVLAAGMIYASARDMAQYMKFHLAAGEIDGKRLMTEAQMVQLHSPQVLFPPDSFMQPDGQDTVLPAYGLGWLVGTFKGHRVIRHAGGRVGFGADIWLFPDERLGIVFLQNLDERSSRSAKVVYGIARHYLGTPLSSQVNHGVSPRPEKWPLVSDHPAACRAVGEASDAAAAGLAGKYRSDLLGDVNVVLEGARPTLVIEPTSVADLVPAPGGTFAACFRGYEAASYPVRFTYDQQKKVSGFVLGEGLFGIPPTDPRSQAVAFKRVP
jgi:CubicO group peptidase (beta-lactamase class C family)